MLGFVKLERIKVFSFDCLHPLNRFLKHFQVYSCLTLLTSVLKWFVFVIKLCWICKTTIEKNPYRDNHIKGVVCVSVCLCVLNRISTKLSFNCIGMNKPYTNKIYMCAQMTHPRKRLNYIYNCILNEMLLCEPSHATRIYVNFQIHLTTRIDCTTIERRIAENQIKKRNDIYKLKSNQKKKRWKKFKKTHTFVCVFGCDRDLGYFHVHKSRCFHLFY